jgi:putative transcriptional regulator
MPGEDATTKPARRRRPRDGHGGAVGLAARVRADFVTRAIHHRATVSSRTRVQRANRRTRIPPVNNRVRELREAKAWSQGDLAVQLDVSRQTVNAIETGRFAPSLPLAFRIARLFRKSIETIFDPAERSR